MKKLELHWGPPASLRGWTQNPGSSRGSGGLQLERRPSSPLKTAITRLADQAQIYEKARLVSKQRHARERVRQEKSVKGASRTWS